MLCKGHDGTLARRRIKLQWKAASVILCPYSEDFLITVESELNSDLGQQRPKRLAKIGSLSVDTDLFFRLLQ